MLDRLHIEFGEVDWTPPPLYLSELQRMVREERAKGSSRLELSYFLLMWRNRYIENLLTCEVRKV